MASPEIAEDYDILFVADVRFEGGTSTALVEEIRAARKASWRVGLLMVKGPLLGRANLPMHPDVRSLIEDGAVDVVDPDAPCSARLTIVHHPTIFSSPPRRSPRVRTMDVVLVLHHPRLDALGQTQYDLRAVVEICTLTFGRPVILAPVSETVRATLPTQLPPRASLLPENWDNIIDPSDWPARPACPLNYPVTIGRHARPHPQKWPDDRSDALAAYSPDPAFCRVRILGGGPYLRELYGDPPANWEELPFSWTGVAEFLQSLDFYVYFHSKAWSEAFGRTTLEAMAVGVPVILASAMRRSFGDAALYCEPGEVVELIEQLVADPVAYERQVQRAFQFVARRSPKAFLDRVRQHFGLDSGPAPRPAVSAVRAVGGRGKSVLYVSTNGVGIGHLTQQMAIADRLPKGVRSIFATMSYAMKVASDAGYLTHFISHHRHHGADSERWNPALRAELLDLIAFTRPSVIAYDGSYPFEGLLDAIREFPEIVSIWVRRPMWRPTHASGLAGSDVFDHVVEPGELADAFDDGPTKPLQNWAHCVAPVLHVDPGDRPSRAEARRALGLSPNGLAVAVQLGAGNNFDISDIRRKLMESLLGSPEAEVVELRSPIRESFAEDVPLGDRHRIQTRFPSFHYSQAFDFAVAGAGYNTFHENIFGAIPTIFVPNEAPEMDTQLARAQFAEVYGLGCLLRRDHDRFAVAKIVERMMDPLERMEMVRRCKALPYENGAVAVARLVTDSLWQLRTDVPFVSDAGH